MTITFAGTDNVAFRLAQIVPLAPGRYLFKGLQQTKGLTTYQRPFWSISGYKCSGLALNETMAPETSARQEFTLPFTVPDSCQAVQVALQRNTSYFFDNKLAGTITVEGLRIEPLVAEAAPLPPQALAPEKSLGKSSATPISINKLQVH